MEIAVQPTGWESEIAEMQRLLENVVQHFLRHFANPPSGRIKVEYRVDGPPMTVFRPSSADDYRILLPSRGRYWAQCSYQFAHEFCHVLCDFEKPRAVSNNWFQES